MKPTWVVTARDYINRDSQGKNYNPSREPLGSRFDSVRSKNLSCALAAILLLTSLLRPSMAMATESSVVASSIDEPLVDIAKSCPGVRIDLRYATNRNITGQAIYPAGARALLRQSTAEKLKAAQTTLNAMGIGLKVWDAYRPSFAQELLWAARPHPDFVADPAKGGSLHERGVAVDLTIIDLRSGQELAMPSGFDEFGPSAARLYRGGNPSVAANLTALQTAMVRAGFVAMRDEWWHFVDKDFSRFGRLRSPPSLVEEASSLQP